MKTLVLGSTGHIGCAIVRALLDEGHDVTALSRRESRPPNLEGLDVRYVRGDIDEPGELDEGVRGHNLVVDAAAPYPIYPTLPGDDDPVLHGIRRTRYLLSALKRHQARLVYVSSFTTRKRPLGVSGFRSQFARVLYPYFEVKARIESLILDEACDGLPAIVVNPTACFGPWDVRARELCTVPHLLTGDIPVVPEHTINVIDVRDVASAVVQAIEKEMYARPILLSGHNRSLSALFRWICEIGDAPMPRRGAPAGLLHAASYWSEMALSAVGLKTPSPSLGLMLVCESTHTNPSPEQRELGLVPRSLSTTIRDTIDWYRRIGYC